MQKVFFLCVVANKIKWNIFVVVICWLSIEWQSLCLRVFNTIFIRLLCIVFYFGLKATKRIANQNDKSSKRGVIEIDTERVLGECDEKRNAGCHSIFESLMWVCLFIYICVSICRWHIRFTGRIWAKGNTFFFWQHQTTQKKKLSIVDDNKYLSYNLDVLPLTTKAL